MATMTRFILPGVLFLVVALTGVWLSRYGKPLNALIMAVHKIGALVTVVLLAVAVYRLAQSASLGGAELAVMVVAAAIGLALFASGVWLSFGKPLPSVVLLVHKSTSVLTVVATAAAAYLLFRAA